MEGLLSRLSLVTLAQIHEDLMSATPVPSIDPGFIIPQPTPDADLAIILNAVERHIIERLA